VLTRQQDRDFLAQDEQFGVLRRLRTRQQHQPPGQPASRVNITYSIRAVTNL
jgi:hypothetical protein